MCKRNGFNPKCEFETNPKVLERRRFLSPTTSQTLLNIWAERNDYHHLNPSIEQDRKKLKNLARGKALLLNEVEAAVFNYSVNDGKLVPKYSQYWDEHSPHQVEVYLRFE